MSQLDEVLGPHSQLSPPAKERVKTIVLDLIEQSKDKMLPLTWLKKEVEKL